MRADEREHGTLEGAAIGEDAMRLVRERRHERLLAPREDRRHLELIAGLIDTDDLFTCQGLGGDFLKLSVERVGVEGFASQPSATNGAAAEGEKHAWVAKRHEDVLFDAVERE